MSKIPKYTLDYSICVWYDFIVYENKIICEDCIKELYPTMKIKPMNKHIHCVRKTVFTFPKVCSVCNVKVFRRQIAGKCFYHDVIFYYNVKKLNIDDLK